VLAGLSTPVDWIAFEALPALPRVTTAALERLASLGDYEFNYISGENHGFEHSRWRDGTGIAAALTRSGGSGDIYARLGGAAAHG
jgi:hypothetical protein